MALVDPRLGDPALTNPSLGAPGSADETVGDAQIHVSRIAELMSKEFVITCGETTRRVKLGAAVGVATWRPGETVTEVLQRADADMYEQKLRNTP